MKSLLVGAHRRKNFWDDAFPFFILALVYVVLLSRFDLKLLFTDTILTGGDTASWFQVLHTLKTDFLPHGRLFGFSQSNFFGYLEGQHYFVLPFLFAAFLGYIVPLTVALKIATVLGGFALPATIFIAVSSMTGKRRLAAVASAASLMYLFNESWTIFGGNWLSTFAGEFCYSWAIALLPLFVASVRKDDRQNGNGAISGLLLGLIGLSHLFVFMPAFFLPFFPAFRTIRKIPRSWDKSSTSIIARIAVTYVVAFGLMAFWFIPMVTTRTWAQPISMIWYFPSIGDFLKQTAALITGLCFLFFLAGWLRRKTSLETRRENSFFAYSIAVCVFLFVTSPGLGMPDIRFAPTALLFSMMGVFVAAAPIFDQSLGVNDKKDKQSGKPNYSLSFRPWILNTIAATFVIVFCSIAISFARNSPNWYKWNYSGYEAKPQWPVIEQLSVKYHGNVDSGRMLWEKQDQKDNADFGSERAFENLYLFTGRPSTEGINYGSSMMARAATYLQSSYSLHPVDPEPERIYSVVDPSSWPARFTLLNARYIITYSKEISSAFMSQLPFRLDSKIGKFSIFEYRDFPDRYVQPIPAGDLSIVKDKAGGGFRTDYYRFFRDYELYGFPFVSDSFADANLRRFVLERGMNTWGSYDEYRNFAFARLKVPFESNSVLAHGGITSEHVDNFKISFTTMSPGIPHLIKISYAPGWHSLNGEKIYPASPGFMLIIPKTDEVELVYGRTTAEIPGIVLTLLTFPFAFFVGKRKKRSSIKDESDISGDTRKKTFGSLNDSIARISAIGAFMLFAASCVALTSLIFTGYPALARDIGVARRLDLADPTQQKEVLALTKPWATLKELNRFDNMLTFDAFRIRALALEQKGKPDVAQGFLDVLKVRYAHTRALDLLPKDSAKVR
jgi:hypothetical protein